MKTTESDPIIAELRAVRDEHAARFNYDVAAIFRDLRAKHAAISRDYVRYTPRHIGPGWESEDTP